MRTGYRVLFCAILALYVAGCATQKPVHESQRDPDTDFAAYSTFGWMPQPEQADAPMQLVDVNIRSAITEQMKQRGYAVAETGPQLFLTYEFIAQDTLKSNPFRIGIGVGSWGGSSGGSVNVGSSSVKNVREGRLVIHALDAAANRELWFGSIAGSLDNNNPDAGEVQRMVELAMQDFPSRAGAAEPAAP